MKVRLGFVSNSSSSSFLCQICGGEVSGMDMCLDDAGFIECVKKHVFCEDHVTEEIREKAEEEDEEEWRYEFPSKYCPICQLKELRIEDVATYMMMRQNTSMKAIVEEIQTTYCLNPNEFYEHLTKFEEGEK